MHAYMPPARVVEAYMRSFFYLLLEWSIARARCRCRRRAAELFLGRFGGRTDFASRRADFVPTLFSKIVQYQVCVYVYSH